MISSANLTDDGRRDGIEASRFLAPGTVSSLIDWPLPPDSDGDDAIPGVASAIARALTSCGCVAFRCDSAPSGAQFIPGRETGLWAPAERVIRSLGLVHDESFGIATTSEPQAATALFRYGGWSYAEQAALVFDPSADTQPIHDALRRGLDWRRRALPTGVRLLFGPGHDGAFAVVSAITDEWLARFAAALNAEAA